MNGTKPMINLLFRILAYLQYTHPSSVCREELRAGTWAYPIFYSLRRPTITRQPAKSQKLMAKGLPCNPCSINPAHIEDKFQEVGDCIDGKAPFGPLGYLQYIRRLVFS